MPEAEINRPLVSVVMPVWNAAGSVAAAVASVRAQTLKAWELIVVDDGSTDGSAGVVERAAAEDLRVRIVRGTHRGIVGALNAGLELVRGAFIARMDADDVSMPDRFAAQVALLRERPEIGVAGCLVDFGGDAEAAGGYALHVRWINELIEPEAIARARFIESPLAHPSVMFRRELVARHGAYLDDGLPEDYGLWLRWTDAGVRFAKVPRVLLRWNDPPLRLSRTDARYGEQAFYACKCRYLACWIRREVGDAREVWLWGAGRVTRKRFAALERDGVRIAGFVDVDPKKAGRVLADGRRVILPESLASPRDCFVIAGVGTRGARELIRTALVERGFIEGWDFVCAA